MLEEVSMLTVYTTHVAVALRGPAEKPVDDTNDKNTSRPVAVSAKRPDVRVGRLRTR